MGRVARAEQLRRAVEDQTEAIRKAARQHAEALETALQNTQMGAGTVASRAAREHAAAVEKAISEQWRLQSRAKTQTASELFDLGMLDDALQHAIEAAEQDRSNLVAWTLAGSIAQKKEMAAEAYSYFQKALVLLKAPEYRSAPEAYRIVVLAMPGDHWTLHAKFREVLKDAASSFSSFPETQPLLEVLIARDLLEDARTVVDDFLGRQPTVEVFAYAVEIADRMNRTCSEELRAYLQAVPVSKRTSVQSEFSNARRFTALSTKTIETVRHAVLARLEQWRPEIQSELQSEARRQANRRAASGLASAFIAFLLMLIPGIALLGKAHWILIGAGSLLAATIAAQVEKTIRRDVICRRILKASCTRESQAWIPAVPIKVAPGASFWRSAVALSLAVISITGLAYFGSFRIEPVKAAQQRRAANRRPAQSHPVKQVEDGNVVTPVQPVPVSRTPEVSVAPKRLPTARPKVEVPKSNNLVPSAEAQDGLSSMRFIVALKGLEQCSEPIELASHRPAACTDEDTCMRTISGPEGTLYHLEDGTEGPLANNAVAAKTGSVCFKGAAGQNVTITYSLNAHPTASSPDGPSLSQSR